MLSANWIIFQLYHGENELHFDDDDDDDDDDDSHFVLDQHAELEFNSASWLRQQSAGRQTCYSTLTHYSDSESTSLCSYLFNTTYLAERQ
jgi:hypothetical protein